MKVKTIEYFYSAHSAFAYIGSRKLQSICATQEYRIEHRPIDLGPVVKAAGGPSFAERTPAHIAYYFGREITRWAEYRQMPIIHHRPTYHDKPLALPNGMLIAASRQNADAGTDAGTDVDVLAHAILAAHWQNNADISDANTLAAVAIAAGVDPVPLLDAALSAEVQQIHKANTQEAIDRQVFGSPSYFLDGDMFYGQDHLELLERALWQPFSATAFVNP